MGGARLTLGVGGVGFLRLALGDHDDASAVLAGLEGEGQGGQTAAHDQGVALGAHGMET